MPAWDRTLHTSLSLADIGTRKTESAKANRQDLISEANAKRDSARNLAKLERKRKQVEAMGEKQEARETGEDLERKRAWDYTIEDNEKWDKKLARKGRRGDFSFTGTCCCTSQGRARVYDELTRRDAQIDYDDIARRKYKKVSARGLALCQRARHTDSSLCSLQDMDTFKPDLASYNKQRTAAQQSLALVASAESGTISNSNAAQDLYRDANSFVYADHKPSEDAIDRVIGKINMEFVLTDARLERTHTDARTRSLDKRQKRSRERKNEDEGDITYINEKVSVNAAHTPFAADSLWLFFLILRTSTSTRR